MRKTKTTGSLKVHAVSGTYVVILGINLPENLCEGLLGFSIHRKNPKDNEALYLQGMKAFAETDPGFPPGSLYSTKDHPVQSFQWADYSAKPGYTYTYTVAALRGTPNDLVEFASTSIEIVTESPQGGDHDVYFNRGTAASQEYVRRFGNLVPDDVVPQSSAFEWLSRGLYEALTDYIESCVPQRHSLRIAAYEFAFTPFLELLKKTSQRGVDVQIVFDERKDKPGIKNREAISAAGIADLCTPRKKGRSAISHNKFIVKLDNDVPVSVWTGGTNFSEGGIYGHSNVAHVIEDSNIAASFLKYWTELQLDPENDAIKAKTEEISPLPVFPVPTGTSVIFSPRTNLAVLDLYSNLAMNAKDGLLMTFAFGMNKVFQDVYKNSRAPFRLALMEKATRTFKKTEEQKKKAEEAQIQILRNMPENVFSIGNFITTNKFDGWVKEKLTGFNVNVNFIHNKFMLIDPLGNDPIVIAGSANFSAASTDKNDENMVIVRGNTRVADIYLGEFMRLFKHFSFRESLKFREPDQPPKPLRTDDWWKASFGNTPEASRRKFFAKVNE
jgi:hypothetical protein